MRIRKKAGEVVEAWRVADLLATWNRDPDALPKPVRDATATCVLAFEPGQIRVYLANVHGWIAGGRGACLLRVPAEGRFTLENEDTVECLYEPAPDADDDAEAPPSPPIAYADIVRAFRAWVVLALANVAAIIGFCVWLVPWPLAALLTVFGGILVVALTNAQQQLFLVRVFAPEKRP